MSQVGQLFADDIIAIDGKTLRGSSHKQGFKRASHLINAYHPRLGLTLGSTITPNKSNKIKGIPILLKALNIEKTIITMDAMGTQKGIANLIRLKKADYVLALEKNHKRMYKQMDTLFNGAEQLGYNAMVYQQKESTHYEHSRFEMRKYTILPAMYLFKYCKKWKDLSAFICVDSQRHLPSGTIKTTRRYYITSIPYKKHRKMQEAIREHWQIENGLHWKLDVGLREDQCPIYRGFADRNLSIMRKIVLKLLNDDKLTQTGIAMKRIKAALPVQYLKKW